MMNINEKVKIILENISEIEIKQNIDNIFLREELQLSSLDMLWIIVDIEKEFKITIEEDEVYSIFTGKDLIECIKNKLSQV